MNDRQIVIDTETTGLYPNKGHRIIEIACLEMIDRKLTGKTIHMYFRPDIKSDPSALLVHGISNKFLLTKPKIENIIDKIMLFIKGSELIIHNAPFDISFINSELQRLKNNNWGIIENHCTICDTLIMARKKHPGQKNSLDALCKRYKIHNKRKRFHGALVDAKLLANVYLMISGGQTKLNFTFNKKKINQPKEKL